MDYGKQSNLNISTVKDSEKTIAIAVNVMFIRNNPQTGEKQMAIHKRIHPGKAGYNQYALPGGTQDGAEMKEQAVIREMQEEVGVTISLNDIKLNNVFECMTVTKKGDEVQKILHFYHFGFVCEKWQGKFINNEPNKHTDLEWVDISKLPLDNFFISKGNVVNYINNVPFSTDTDFYTEIEV